MPWAVTDVNKHKAGLTDEQKKQWVAVANTARENCIADGGEQDVCDASAIRQANAAIQEVNVSKNGKARIEAKRLEEAATIKAAVQGFLRAAHALLGEKALPNALKEQIENLRTAMRKTWKDLEADAEPEAATEAERDDADEDDEEADKPTKTEDGKAYFKSDFGYTPSDKPSEWKLRLVSVPAGDPDPAIVGAACAALGKGFRGQKVQIPAEDLPAVKAKVRAAWKKANPDKEDDEMPPAIREGNEESEEEPITEAALIGDCVPLVEKALRPDGTARIRIIQPGWGSSGFYSPEVLARDGPKVFKAKTQSFWDHPTATEESERPERSLRDLAGELITDAVYEEDGPAGPGLYADMKVFEPYRAALEELAPHIGMSIRALGKAKPGEAEGKSGPIVQEIVSAKSIDAVTVPGAGGQILSLFESARQKAMPRKEIQVTPEEAKKLTDENAVLKTENARLKETALLAEARAFVAAAMPPDVPELTQKRLLEVLSAKPVIKEGKLDEAAYRPVIEAAIKSELDYIAKVAGSGRITGMGGSPPPDGKAQLKESFKGMYLRQGKPEAEAERLAGFAAQGR